ncbi:MAG: hydroxymethylglutaryl-CoA synthase [Deltaproteobacteria bacterium]|nr:hydroxymethylglutaryl-CoA synthase [Deltaproteobacteria bacterium]
MPGVSGLSLYVPRPCVSLDDWCAWTGAPADKVRAVVGHSFRMCAPAENVYTMAASAALRLIDAYDIDPRRVGMLALGTESSTDNAAGAVIVKGMLDRALQQQGRAPLSRWCEVPEIKHACLGGMYALKGALRYAACDADDRVALVIAADVAEYARGSTGEQTQGAGAVAMLVEREPTLFSVDLSRTGSAAAYRGADFRKPMARHFMPDYDAGTRRLHDFPVFNGKYSTLCYLDEVIAALEDMFERVGQDMDGFYAEVAAVMLHRPYHHLPIQAMAHALVWSMGRSDAHPERFDALCEQAQVDPDRARAQVRTPIDLVEQAEAHGPDTDPFADAQRVAKHYGRSPQFRRFVAEHMSLGTERVKALGNLYTGSLPAWLAAAFDDAHARDLDLAGKSMLAVGYGSGDAAEAWPLRVADRWREAAARIDFDAALADALPLDQPTYEALHDGTTPPQPIPSPRGFAIADVGRRNAAQWQDIGVEYYRFAG